MSTSKENTKVPVTAVADTKDEETPDYSDLGSGPALPHTGHLDLADLALAPDFSADDTMTDRMQMTIPLEKANRKKFVQFNPNMSQTVAAVDVGDRGGIYVVTRSLQDELADEIVPVALFVGITRQGNLFVHPVKLSGKGGKMHDASKSALRAVEIGKKSWVRIIWDDDAKSYIVRKPQAALPPPIWPAMTLSEIMTAALSDRVIDSPQHPVIRQLRGED